MLLSLVVVFVFVVVVVPDGVPAAVADVVTYSKLAMFYVLPNYTISTVENACPVV